MTFPRVTVRRVARILNGGTPPSGVAEFWGGEVSFVTPPDLNGLDGAPLESTARTITVDGVAHSGLAPAGSVLLSTRAPIGHIGRLTSPAAFNQGCRALVPARNHEARFLAYALVAARADMDARGLGTTFLELSGSSLAQVEVPLAPLEAQRAIADYLDRETAQIDAFITKNEELIALLAERRAAIVSRRVAKGLDSGAPAAEMAVGGLERVPAHWRVERFARVARIRGGLLDPSDSRFESWALIAPNHIRSGTGELIELVAASEQSAESGKYPVKKGDVVYSKIRPALAKAVIAPEDCLCSADMYGITSRNPDVLDNRYLRWQMLSKWFTEWATERSMRVAMPKVNQDTLRSAPIIVPPIDEQVDIVERIEVEVEAVSGAISVARRSVDLARERRVALISAAVTGKIDVGVAV